MNEKYTEVGGIGMLREGRGVMVYLLIVRVFYLVGLGWC